MLTKAASLAPNEGHEKFMYLSQLTEGEESLRHSRAGIDILRLACRNQAEDPAYREDLEQQLCQALCSLVESMLNARGHQPSSSAAPDASRVVEEATALLDEARR